jgi:hypothetical protein
MEHVALRLGDPAERVGVDADEAQVRAIVDHPGLHRHARGLEQRPEVRGSRVVGRRTNLPQGLLERQDELQGDADLIRDLRVGPGRERGPAELGAVQERKREAAVVDGTGDRLDREAATIRRPHEPHAVDVGVGEHPLLARGHDPELDEAVDVGGRHAGPLGQLVRVARAHGGRMICLTCAFTGGPDRPMRHTCRNPPSS